MRIVIIVNQREFVPSCNVIPEGVIHLDRCPVLDGTSEERQILLNYRRRGKKRRGPTAQLQLRL